MSIDRDLFIVIALIVGLVMAIAGTLTENVIVAVGGVIIAILSIFTSSHKKGD